MSAQDAVGRSMIGQMPPFESSGAGPGWRRVWWRMINDAVRANVPMAKVRTLTAEFDRRSITESAAELTIALSVEVERLVEEAGSGLAPDGQVEAIDAGVKR
jgi:hypothetical protein